MLHHIDAVIFCTSAVNKFSLSSHPPILLLYSIHLQLLSFKTQEKLKKKVNASVMDKLENAENEYVELNKKKLVSIHNGRNELRRLTQLLSLDWCFRFHGHNRKICVMGFYVFMGPREDNHYLLQL
jgi:mRNA degradation ribonuclease J1/J2